jgi:hypothetical protein
LLKEKYYKIGVQIVKTDASWEDILFPIGDMFSNRYIHFYSVLTEKYYKILSRRMLCLYNTAKAEQLPGSGGPGDPGCERPAEQPGPEQNGTNQFIFKVFLTRIRKF